MVLVLSPLRDRLDALELRYICFIRYRINMGDKMTSLEYHDFVLYTEIVYCSLDISCSVVH